MGYTCGRNLNYAFCRTVASTCISRTDLVGKDKSVYYKALRMGWLDEFATEFSYMDKSDAIRHTKHINGHYMTDDEIKIEARKYTTLAQFRHRSPNAYMIASGKRSLIKKFTWLKRCPSDALPQNGDTVYVYEFIETHAAYVGRTCNLKHRDQEHRRKKDDSLYQYSMTSGFAIPTPKVLHTGITIERGAELERNEIERYRSEGWNMINRCKGGSIGSLGIGISKKKLIKTAQQYTTLKDFKHDHLDMVNLIYRMGWENEFSWLEKTDYIKWTREQCEAEARKYILHKDFRHNSHLAYRAAKSHGWLKDYTWLVRRINWNDFGTVANESKKYASRSKFMDGNSSAYRAAIRNGWIELLYPPKTAAPSGYWDIYNNVVIEAKKFKTRSAWEKKSHGSYLGAKRNGWLDMLMPPKYVRRIKDAA